MKYIFKYSKNAVLRKKFKILNTFYFIKTIIEMKPESFPFDVKKMKFPTKLKSIYPFAYNVYAILKYGLSNNIKNLTLYNKTEFTFIINLYLNNSPNKNDILAAFKKLTIFNSDLAHLLLELVLKSFHEDIEILKTAVVFYLKNEMDEKLQELVRK